MKIALIVVIALVGLIGIAFLVGLALPRNHRATSSIALRKPPAEVWAVVRDLGALQGTWKELKSARRLPDEGGREVWEQNAGGFDMRLIIESSNPPSRLVTRIDADEKAAFGGTWTYTLTPAGNGTTVSIVEDGFVTNPLFRVMMALMGKHRTLDGYLRALADKFDEPVKPEHVRSE
jgi:polyketide cyclase/dehydrase/lipid transport protein